MGRAVLCGGGRCLRLPVVSGGKYIETPAGGADMFAVVPSIVLCILAGAGGRLVERQPHRVRVCVCGLHV